MAPATNALSLLRDFLAQLKQNNIEIKQAYLFGSCARKTNRELSDIDVALVSESFSGIPFYDRQKLNPFILSVSTDIEVHPFCPYDFTEDDPFVEEIIKTGVKLI